jgi:hypothetical protein
MNHKIKSSQSGVDVKNIGINSPVVRSVVSVLNGQSSENFLFRNSMKSFLGKTGLIHIICNHRDRIPPYPPLDKSNKDFSLWGELLACLGLFLTVAFLLLGVQS